MTGDAIEALSAGDVERALALLPADDELTVFEAAAFGRLQRLEELLRADPSRAAEVSGDGFTALHLAVFGGQEEAARLLIEHGADVDALATSEIARVAPLGTAAFVRSAPLAALLLDAGADVNRAGAGGFTDLHSDAQSDDEELVRLLLARGADPLVETADGRRPGDLARAAAVLCLLPGSQPWPGDSAASPPLTWRSIRGRPQRCERAPRRMSVDLVGTLVAAGRSWQDRPVAGGADIVDTVADAEAADRPPLLVLERLEAFLDSQGLGTGPARAERIGDGGGSNFSFLVERGPVRLVLRRPPRPPLPPSAHDMVREARLQLALAPHGIRLPPIVAVCEDEDVLGVPFYVMEFLDGHIVTSELPPGLEDPAARHRLGEELVDALVEIHAADVEAPALAAFVRPGSYLERQVRRFAQLWEINATRDIPVVAEVGRRLAETVPNPLPSTVVHGDYRLGNLMVERDRPDRVQAVLDWEMGAIGDPRADLGYLLATYAEPGGEPGPLGVSPVTALEGFPSKAELVERYSARSGRTIGPLGWFEALALWKAAVFCEAIFGRFQRGELGAEDSRAAGYERSVPLMAETAAARLEDA